LRYAVNLNVNGTSYKEEIEPHRSLLSVLRGELGLTGTKEGCDDSECGACMILVEGHPVNSCSYLAIQANGQRIETVEGLSSDGHLHPLQRAFIEEGGVQCGFCTPGMLMSAKGLLDIVPQPTEQEVKRYLAGNLCRCTGYSGIIRAVLKAAGEARVRPA
jgi:aerobic-type carbon monoxide dehydrogenase small subunit (CoxS/CutS family)